MYYSINAMKWYMTWSSSSALYAVGIKEEMARKTKWWIQTLEKENRKQIGKEQKEKGNEERLGALGFI